MGNEQSIQIDESVLPQILDKRDLASVAKYVKSPECKRIFVMNGAGVSTSAGIPDFRSPETGLYHNLQRLNLPYPEAVFEISFFRENPIPFYALAKELMPGKFRPTITHSFVRLLAEKNLLGMCYTQNIDTLERLAGVPAHKIVEAHGSFADQHCIDCGAPYDSNKIRDHIRKGSVPTCDQCDGLVKPDIVFFGESLPPRFSQTVPLLRSADLLIVMGTSLTVHPFASLASMVPENCPRVLINMDQVGDFGTRTDDVVCLGKTDEVVKEFCRLVGDGWEKELEDLWKETEKAVVEVMEEPVEEEETEEEKIKKEVDLLTSQVEKALEIGEVPKEGDKTSEKIEKKKDEEEKAGEESPTKEKPTQVEKPPTTAVEAPVPKPEKPSQANSGEEEVVESLKLDEVPETAKTTHTETSVEEPQIPAKEVETEIEQVRKEVEDLHVSEQLTPSVTSEPEVKATVAAPQVEPPPAGNKGDSPNVAGERGSCNSG
ncbi:sirtuin family protein [Abortiporus biennis]